MHDPLKDKHVVIMGFARQGQALARWLPTIGARATVTDSRTEDAFDLELEPREIREKYDTSRFGRGCLLARRLVERGVTCVEVRSGNWDTHQDNFSAVKSLCGVLDPAYSSLITDLNDRGLLQDTLVIWMGEFGRTPKINDNTGRDHWPKSWSTVLAGGGIRGGQAFGCTSDDGSEITDNPVTAQNLIATICAAVQ